VVEYLYKIISKGEISMKMRKLITWLLIIATLLTSLMLVGCNPDDSGDDDDDDYELPEEELSPAFDGEAIKFSGNYTVLTRNDRSKGQAFNIVDLVESDNLGDTAIVKAVRERNEKIKSNFGVTIKRRMEQSVYDVASNQIRAEDATYDAFMITVNSGLRLACGGGVLDLNEDVEYLDLSNKWWDQGVNKNLILARKSYIAIGDVLTVDKDATWCVLFNKSNLVSKQQGLSDQILYDLVRDGDGVQGGWTVERLNAFAAKHYTEENNEDINGHIYEQGYTGNGMYGLYTQKEAVTVVLQAAGFTPTVVDSTEACGLKDNIKSNTAFDNAVLEMKGYFGDVTNQEWFLDLDTVCKGAPEGVDWWETRARASFKNNRATFFMCHIGTIDLVSDMSSDFGVLPVPKLNESQLEYGNTIQYSNATCYILPDRNKEALNDKAGYILEAMCYYSSQEYADTESLNYAYYNKVLRGKGTRDDDSWKMLDYIFDNRVFDLACALNLSSVNSVITGAACNSTGNWVSSKASKLSNLGGAINKQLETLMTGTSG